jgi:hypothetical protein
MDHYAPQVQKAPLIPSFGPPGTVKDIQAPFPGIVFDMPFQARKVNAAGNRGNYKKIGPKIELPHIHNHYLPPVVFGEEFSQFHRLPGGRGGGVFISL